MKWESDDELRGAREDVVSENALLGGGLGMKEYFLLLR